MTKGGFHVFTNVPNTSDGKKHHDLAKFKEMFDSLGAEYEFIPPDKDSPYINDIIGISRLVIKGYEITFDVHNKLLGIKNI